MAVLGILQAGILEWGPCPPPGGLPNRGIKPSSLRSPALTGGFFTTSAPREALAYYAMMISALGKRASQAEKPPHHEGCVGLDLGEKPGLEMSSGTISRSAG